MAQYRRPEDPRKSDGPIDRGNHDRQPIPWLWLILGFVVTGLSIAAALFFVDQMLTRDPLPVAAAPRPTVIRLTAPATPEPTATRDSPTPTSIPTLTPSPTPDRAVAPEVLTAGFFAQVGGTDGIGLSVRTGASTVNELVFIAPDGTTVFVLDGPIENGDFQWWQLQFDDGSTGWAVDLFLEPAPEPASWPGQ